MPDPQAVHATMWTGAAYRQTVQRGQGERLLGIVVPFLLNKGVFSDAEVRRVHVGP